MTLEQGVKFADEMFKERYNLSVGKIVECSDFWVIYSDSKELDYGLLPIIIYKNSRPPEDLNFGKLIELHEEIDNGKVIKEV